MKREMILKVIKGLGIFSGISTIIFATFGFPILFKMFYHLPLFLQFLIQFSIFFSGSNLLIQVLHGGYWKGYELGVRHSMDISKYIVERRIKEFKDELTKKEEAFERVKQEAPDKIADLIRRRLQTTFPEVDIKVNAIKQKKVEC